MMAQTVAYVKLPTLKMLREEKNRLTKLQTVQRDEFNTRRADCGNVFSDTL